jgi:hypothetical protein
LKVTIQALDWRPDGAFQPLTDDIASTKTFRAIQDVGRWWQ